MAVALAPAPVAVTRAPDAVKPSPPAAPRIKTPPPPIAATPAAVTVAPAVEYPVEAIEESWYMRTAASAPVFFGLATVMVIAVTARVCVRLLGVQLSPVVHVALAVVGAAVAVYGLLLGTAAVLLAVDIARELRRR